VTRIDPQPTLARVPILREELVLGKVTSFTLSLEPALLTHHQNFTPSYRRLFDVVRVLN
jgi:hypothetical protein